jgi:hypothetical protein
MHLPARYLILPTKTQHFVGTSGRDAETRKDSTANAEIRIEILDCMTRDPGNIQVAEGSSTRGQFLQ